MAHTTAFAAVSDACREAVAAIASSIVQVHGRPRRPASGLVVAAERVVTTSHSVEWEDELKIRLGGGETLAAQVAGRDPGTDLVLLRVPGLTSPAARLATSPAATGALALIVGRTWANNLKARLTSLTHIAGPIRVGGGRSIDGVIGLDAGPYAGFSGSAVLLPDGAVAGLATAGLLRGNGLAVPGALLSETIDALETHGGVRRGFLGITTQPVRVPEAQRRSRAVEEGLLIVGIADAAPASAAGLFVGDILVAFDGHEVAEPEQLLTHLSGDRIGTAARLDVIRGIEVVEVSVTIGERPARG